MAFELTKQTGYTLDWFESYRLANRAAQERDWTS
jgi:hypothetical protein